MAKKRTPDQVRAAARASLEHAALQTENASIRPGDPQPAEAHPRGHQRQRHYGAEPNNRRFPLALFAAGGVLLIAALAGTYHALRAIFNQFMRFL